MRWNILRTLRERDRARLATLEEIVSDISADVERIQRTTDRIDARLRTRSARAGESFPAVSADAGGSADSSGSAPGTPLLVADAPPPGGADFRTVDRATMRARRRAKFGG